MPSIIDSQTIMFVNVSRNHGIKVTGIFLLTSNIKELYPKPQTNKSSKTTLQKFQKIFTKMKILTTLLLVTMVATSMEKCAGRYLLVEIEEGKYFLFS